MEGWLHADGEDVAPGFRRCAAPARTILDSGEDGGNFPGVALYSEGEETVLVAEMEAGWYRYVSKWRFHADGTIRPRFGFAAVADSCVCNPAPPPRLLAGTPEATASRKVGDDGFVWARLNGQNWAPMTTRREQRRARQSRLVQLGTPLPDVLWVRPGTVVPAGGDGPGRTC
jgi:hypothetical protein